jgi:hypothetical protein
MMLTTPPFKTNDSKTDLLLRPLASSLILAALFAAIAVLPARAEDVSPSPAASTTGPATTLGDMLASPLNANSGIKTVETVLPSGAIRRTVLRVPTRQAETQPLARQAALADNMLKMPLQPNVLAMRRQAGVPGHPLSVDLRLGVSVSPRIKFVGGIDARIPGLSLGPGFTTRADLDAVVSANFGGGSTLFPLTIDELYHADLPGGTGLYGGLGIGPMLGERTRFGGKIIVGANITPRLRLEGNVLFAGYGDTLFNVLLRIPVL